MSNSRMTQEEARTMIEEIELIWKIQKAERKAWSKAEPMSEKRLIIDMKLEGLRLAQQARYDKLHAHYEMDLPGLDSANDSAVAA